MYWIWDVEIPLVDGKGNKVEVKHYPTKSKASAIILSNKRMIKDLDLWSNKEFQLITVSLSEYAFRYINNPDEEVQIEAVKRYGYNIGL